MTPTEYRKSHPDCCYCIYLRKHHKSHYHPRGQVLELDHIWGRKGPCDTVSNWIMACPQCHDLKTVSLQKLGRIAAVHYKLLNREIDLDDVKACSGYDLLGWLENEQERLKLSPEWERILRQSIFMAQRLDSRSD